MVQRPKNLEKKHVLNLKGIFVNGTMKPAGSRAVVAPTMAGMMEEVTNCGSSCRIHIFRRVPRAAATCLISARVELPSVSLRWQLRRPTNDEGDQTFSFHGHVRWKERFVTILGHI